MNILEAIILGIVQGLTEFIPVSSSGHLVIIHDAMGASKGDLAFDVALHVGTLFALVVYFWKDIKKLLTSLMKQGKNAKLVWVLLVATIPAVIVGVLLQSAAETIFRSKNLVAINLIVVGFIMILVEKWYKRSVKKTVLEKTNYKQATIIGLAQSLAIVPGVSRSGSTIVAGMFAGLDRVSATRFSFLLGLPIIGGAALKVLLSADAINQIQTNPVIFAVGAISAGLSGIFAIRFMLKFLGNNGLEAFAYYRITFGAIILLTSLLLG